MRRSLIYIVPLVMLLAAIFFFVQGLQSRHEKIVVGKFPEQIVYAQSKDDVFNAGAIFSAPQDRQKPVAVIWIHGWGVNFYQPSYVMIGRALAERGYTTIVGNTRMHDLANVEGFRSGNRIRGGGYWGITSDETNDIGAWIGFAENLGFKHVVLVGHSAGWAAVRSYQYLEQDRRVIGLVAASGQVQPDDSPDPQMLADANRFVTSGQGDELIQLPAALRSYPSYISAATYLDLARIAPPLVDFYGIRSTGSAGVAAIRCPLLVMFGTDGDVGSAKDLEIVKSSIRRQPSGPPRVDAAMIRGGNHMYEGQEKQVADILAGWIGSLPAQ